MLGNKTVRIRRRIDIACVLCLKVPQEDRICQPRNFALER